VGNSRLARCAVAGFSASILLAACAAPTAGSTPQVVRVYATSAAAPWLGTVYDCAAPSKVVQLVDSRSADFQLRLGAPPQLDAPAYQIGIDDLLVIVHPETGVSSLALDQVRQLFAGQLTNWKEVGGADLAVQVWTFSPGEDVQAVFDQAALRGESVTSMARLAVSAQAMSDSVGTNPGSIGLLPRRWKAGNTREALVVSSVPVLALVKSEPKGDLKELIGCLQSTK
jgi:hypothetical protein